MHPRSVGLDVGTRRVGIAVADGLGLVATPSRTATPDEALDLLAELDGRERIAVVVVGWPLTEDGTEDESTRFVAAYVKRIIRRLPGVRVERVDEGFTSEEARRIIADRGHSERSRSDRGLVDRVAAAVILQEFLDRPDSAHQTRE